MSTNEEFEEAIKLLLSCCASVSCGCEVDETKADWLYYVSKRYVAEFRKRFMHI